MPHTYLLNELADWQAEGLPVHLAYRTQLSLERGRRSEHDVARVIVHAGGYGPDLYATKCRTIRTCAVSSEPLGFTLRNDTWLRDKVVHATICEQCLTDNVAVGQFVTVMDALSRAAVTAMDLDETLARNGDDEESRRRHAIAILRVRKMIELDCAGNIAAPRHPDVVDPQRILGDWWPARYRKWVADLERVKEQLRSTQPLLDQPLVMVTGKEFRNMPAPDREQGAYLAPAVTVEFVEYLATAPVVGYVNRPGMAASPVFLVPDTLWEVVNAHSTWVSLGAPRTGGDREELLGAFARVFRSGEATVPAVAALIQALELDPV